MTFFEICSKKWCANLDVTKICITFVPDSETNYMVDVAQLVRVTDCGSEGRGFESHLPPLKAGCEVMPRIFFCLAEVCKQVSTPAKQKKGAALLLLTRVEDGKLQGYLSRVSPHRHKWRLRHSFGDDAQARHSNPIFQRCPRGER